MVKHFVSGGAGFIGSHLVDRLIKDGGTVTVYDNLSSGKESWIEHHLGKESFSFIHADLLDTDSLKKAMAGHDLIWHFGANTDIPSGNRITDLDLKNCTIATYNVLEAMRENGLKKIIFPSSSTVYGDTPSTAMGEGYGPTLPISLYGAGKLACEGLISSYCHLFDLQAWMFRFGNVMGSRMGHGILYDFIHKLKKNPHELEILGDGNQNKNYFLIEDCLDGIFFTFENADEQCNLFVLGCDTTVQVNDIARIVIEEMGLKDVKFRYTGGRRGWPGDVPVVRFDVSKINKLGWSTRYTSAEAIRIATKRLIEQIEAER